MFTLPRKVSRYLQSWARVAWDRGYTYIATRLIYDCITFNFSVVLAIYLHYLSFLFREFNGLEFTLQFYITETQHALQVWTRYFPLGTIGALGCFWFFGFYNLKKFSAFQQRARSVLLGVFAANALIILLMYFSIEKYYFPRGVTLILLCFSLVLNGGPRLVKPLALCIGKYLAPPEHTVPPRNILVIGGGGYIGSILTRYLLSHGYSVKAMDLMLFGDESLGALESHKRFTLIRGDFRNIADLTPALDNVDAVVHLGGLVGDPACSVKDDLTIDINYAATKVLMELCKGRGIRRFIFASTCSVYGASADIATEESTPAPLSMYARTKVDSERVLLDGADDRFSPTILRFATVFGWSPRPRFDLVVNTFVVSALTRGEIRIHGGSQWRPFVHVLDLARAIEMTLATEERVVGGEIFNVGDDSLNYTIEQVSQVIAKSIPETKVTQLTSVTDQRDYRVSFKKIREKLGFTCSVNLEQGIDELRDAVGQLTLLNPNDIAYNNFHHLNDLLENNSTSVQNLLFKADILEDGFVKEGYEKQKGSSEAA